MWRGGVPKNAARSRGVLSGGACGADGAPVNGELVGDARPTAIAPDDVRPGVVVLDQVRLHRPKRGRGDRRADRASHDASSNLPNNRRCQFGDRAPRPPPDGSVGRSDTATPFGSGFNSTRRRPKPSGEAQAAEVPRAAFARGSWGSGFSTLPTPLALCAARPPDQGSDVPALVRRAGRERARLSATLIIPCCAPRRGGRFQIAPAVLAECGTGARGRVAVGRRARPGPSHRTGWGDAHEQSAVTPDDRGQRRDSGGSKAVL